MKDTIANEWKNNNKNHATVPEDQEHKFVIFCLLWIQPGIITIWNMNWIYSEGLSFLKREGGLYTKVCNQDQRISFKKKKSQSHMIVLIKIIPRYLCLSPNKYCNFILFLEYSCH